MRRVAVILVALFLVNLPLVDESLTERQVSRSGEEVLARVTAARRLGGGWYVGFRLPAAVDPRQRVLSVRVDRGTYDAARRSHTIPVRVVPGNPGRFRAQGQVGNRLFAVVAVSGDLLCLLGALAWWRRRRHRRFAVEQVGPATVTLRRDGLVLTAAAPEHWLLRTLPGQRVAGTLHLSADQDVQALGGGPGLEAGTGTAAYVVRGRVVDVEAQRVHLEVAAGLVIAVQTGPHRNRADLRELAAAAGTLHFTPTGV